MSVVILDNFVDTYYQDTIKNILTSTEFPYFLNLHTVDYGTTGTYRSPLSKDTLQFTHLLMRDNQVTSQVWYLLAPIAAKFDLITGKKHEVVKCKANFNTQINNFNANNYYTPHVDYSDGNITTAIYYVADSDGDTLFFDDNLNIVNKVTPKKGRFVYFNRKQIHSGQAPIKSDFRCLINFNFRELK